MQFVQPPDESDNGLDRLLGEARWPEPTSEQLTRLRDGWTSLQTRRRRRGYLVRVLSTLAASLLLAAGLIALRVPNALQAPVEQNDQIAGQASTAEDDAELARSAIANEKMAASSAALGPDSHPHVENTRVTDTDLPRRVLSQEPSLYERVAMIGLKQSSPKTLLRKKSAPRRIASSASRPDHTLLAPSPLLQRVREWVTMIPASLDDAARQFAVLVRHAERWQWQLVAAFPRHAVRFVSRATVARAMDSGREIPSPSPHAAFVEMVVHQGRPADIANLITQEPDAALRGRLLAALAARGTAEAVEEYLYFVMRPECSVEALDALADVAEPPDGLFLAYFRSPQVSLGLAAALALSRSRDPLVVDIMVSAIDDASLRRQAIVALLLSRDPRAAVIVNEARGNLYLMASVRAAELELHQLAQTP
jgi:hypothetical protein